MVLVIIEAKNTGHDQGGHHQAIDQNYGQSHALSVLKRVVAALSVDIEGDRGKGEGAAQADGKEA